jgi:hypothetical protein
MRLNDAVVSLSGGVFTAIGAANLLGGFDVLGVLMVFVGLSVVVSPLRHSMGRGPSGSGQVLLNGLLLTAFIAALGVFAFFRGLDLLKGNQVGGHVIGVGSLGLSVLSVVGVAWLSIGIRKSWHRWRGR